MDAGQTTATPRVVLPPAHHGAIPLSAEHAGEVYRGLRQLDHRQRVSARAGAPVPLEQECATQSALLLIESLATDGGEISAPFAQLLAGLGLVRLS